MRPPFALTLALMTICTWCRQAYADGTDGADGAYGRLDGDASFQIDVGAGRRDAHNGMHAGLTLRYLQTAGVYSSAIVFFGNHKPNRWITTVGVEVRPLFLPRFLQNLQIGTPTLDLMIDSLALRMGAVTAQSGSLSRRPGLEALIGFSIPLMANASGLWIHTNLGLQWSPYGIDSSTSGAGKSHSDPRRDPPGQLPNDFNDRQPVAVLSIALGWQSVFSTGLLRGPDVSSIR